jgi:hypothetical protein
MADDKAAGDKAARDKAARDWDAEMAKIDRQIEATAHLVPPRSAGVLPAPAAPPVERRSPERVAAASAAPTSAPVHGTRSGRALAGARVVLSVALGVGILFWPYADRCGMGLAAYLAAVGVVVAGGIWSAIWTWRHRTPKSHVLALALVLWGLVLAAAQVLPRTGYARPDATHPALWSCE